ncbi:UNVERIFIED_CONTAM: hypothetical protein PYX00_011132 [Menopon gallinae]|uniref:Deoxyuridine 5'-triphosphate nucleotidohydrolase n=1 Tax=Menopon gallinae TaxID=328185 RepID=A0AAW2H6A4_9NEOP
MENISVPITLLNNYTGETPPFYATEESAGIDLIAAINTDIILKPFERCLVSNGFKMALPKGFEAQIRPRSGLALNYGITVLNSPGTVDSDYRGEIKTLLINLGQEEFTISPGMRISQMVISSVVKTQLNIVTNLQTTTRGEGGFGSTGVK